MSRVKIGFVLLLVLVASIVFAYSQSGEPKQVHAKQTAVELRASEQEKDLALAQHFSIPTPESIRPGGDRWERYFQHDEAYYATSDYTRIYADKPLQPGEVRQPLKPQSGLIGHGRPLQKHHEPLAVQAVPGAPVTFYAPDFGTFSNGERSITVKADNTGRAQAQFTYGKMASFYRVIAHSPEMQPGSWVVFEFSALSDKAWERLETLKSESLKKEASDE